MNKVKIGLCQLDIQPDKERNVNRALEMIREAAAQGADFAILPEIFYSQSSDAEIRKNCEPAGGPTEQKLSALARELGIYIIGGSVAEKEGDKIYNTAFMYDREGKQIAKHRKVHMYEVIHPDGRHDREADTIEPGDRVTMADTEFGPVGIAICYDIRFAEFFRIYGLKCAKIIFHPGNFNLTTGPAHWEMSIRMRALDQQLFMASCIGARNLDAPYVNYGHSMVAGPWGDLKAKLGTEEEVCVVEIDLDEIDQIKNRLPITMLRRTDLYDTKYYGK
jgi:predicted amidohydrolase